jgi:AraC-like DNA-binding protein
MGAFFLAYPTPKDVKLHNYRISLRALAAAYFVMAVLNSLIMFLDFKVQTPEYFNFVVLLMSSLQALLFTYTIIILLNPRFITRRYLFYNLLPIILFALLYLAFAIKTGDCKISEIKDFKACIVNPCVKIRLLFFCYYCFQLVKYVVLFLKHEKIYTDEINNNFSDISRLSLKWVRWAFFVALSVGIMAIFIQILPGISFELFFNIILTLFYFIFALKYINYNKIFYYLAPIIADNETFMVPSNYAPKPRILWVDLKKSIIIEKFYLKEGITLEEMAQMLEIGRTSLSNFINSEEGVSFNTWVNRLRIEEAKSLLSSNPDYSIIKIAELTGYSEQSNFSRQFKIFTGESPSLWRKKIFAY